MVENDSNKIHSRRINKFDSNRSLYFVKCKYFGIFHRICKLVIHYAQYILSGVIYTNLHAVGMVWFINNKDDKMNYGG